MSLLLVHHSMPAARCIAALVVLASLALGVSLSGCASPADAARGAAASFEAAATASVASADGVPIRYRVAGRGDTAVVLVHGWACDATYWRGPFDALTPRHAVVALDLAGHGASGNGRSDWSIDRFGADVAAVVAALPQRRIVLVGHSMGGPAIVAAARLLPPGKQLLGLIGVDTWKNVGLPPMPEAARENIVRAFTADFAGTMRANVRERMFRPGSDPALVTQVADRMAVLRPEVGIPMLGGLFRPDWERGFAGLGVPVVAINADFGGPTDEARIRRVAPTFRAVPFPDSGHFPMLEAPERFNRELLAQIEALVGRVTP